MARRLTSREGTGARAQPGPLSRTRVAARLSARPALVCPSPSTITPPTRDLGRRSLRSLPCPLATASAPPRPPTPPSADPSRQPILKSQGPSAHLPARPAFPDEGSQRGVRASLSAARALPFLVRGQESLIFAVLPRSCSSEGASYALDCSRRPGSSPCSRWSSCSWSTSTFPSSPLPHINSEPEVSSELNPLSAVSRPSIRQGGQLDELRA
jgi:hypothetical protein